jgi:translocation and assembly module TamB
VTGAALRDSLQVRSAFALTDATYELLAHWKDSALAVGGLDTPVHVTSSGRLRLNGRFDNVMRSSGGARIEHLEISRGAERMSVAAPVEAEIDAGRVRVSPFRLDVPGGQATLGGEFAAPAELRVDVEGAVGLAVLELVLPAVSAARGQVQLRTRIAHASDGGWELRGDASVRDAVVDFGLPVALTDGRADLRFDRSRIEIGAASATMGSGRVDLAGTVDVERGPRLSWMLEDVAVSPDRGIEARLSGTGEVGGTWGRLEIGGHVSVLEALYDRNVEMTDVLPALVRRFRPPAPEEEPTLVVLLDLRVHAPDRVFIDNNLAQIELRADLRLRGEARQPSITGTVRLLGGELTLRGNTFTVLAGTIDFRDPFRLNPVLDVTAEADIDSGEDVYTITMHVTGTGEEPRVQFSADDPNLSQNDVISLVAFGKTMTQLQRSAGGTAAADVLAFVPTGTVEEDVRGLIGVDRFEVGASRASDSNAIEPMLTIGKNLSERLRGFVTTTFGVEQRRIVQLEYRWSRRVSVVGSWESETESQAGAFGGDVRFRYEFRRLPFSLLRSDDEAAAADDAD